MFRNFLDIPKGVFAKEKKLSTTVFEWLNGKFIEDKETQLRDMEKRFPIGSKVISIDKSELEGITFKVIEYRWSDTHRRWAFKLMGFAKSFPRFLFADGFERIEEKRCPHCFKRIPNE